MPKLGKDGNVAKKRAQLMDMEKRGLIEIDRLRINEKNMLYDLPDDVYEWPKEAVNEYYDNRVSADMVEWYERVVEEERVSAEKADKAAKEFREKWMKDRPSEQDPAYQQLLRDTYAKNSANVRDAKIAEVKEEFKYRLYTHDKQWGMLSGDHMFEFIELGKKYAVGDYEALETTVKDTEKEMSAIDSQIKDSFPTIPKKPGLLTNMWNRIQKIRSKQDLPSIVNYNKYTELTGKKADLGKNIEAAKSKMVILYQDHGNTIEEAKEAKRLADQEANKEANKEMSKEDRVFKLAKTVITRTLADAGTKDASPEVVENTAKVLMEDSVFQKAVAKLQADTKDVSEFDFFKEYNNIQKANAEKANNQPNVVKTNEELNNNFKLNSDAPSIN